MKSIAAEAVSGFTQRVSERHKQSSHHNKKKYKAHRKNEKENHWLAGISVRVILETLRNGSEKIVLREFWQHVSKQRWLCSY